MGSGALGTVEVNVTGGDDVDIRHPLPGIDLELREEAASGDSSAERRTF
jgi:hypothetical protein